MEELLIVPGGLPRFTNCRLYKFQLRFIICILIAKNQYAPGDFIFFEIVELRFSHLIIGQGPKKEVFKYQL